MIRQLLLPALASAIFSSAACGDGSPIATPTITPTPFVGEWERFRESADVLTGKELVGIGLQSDTSRQVVLVRCTFNSAIERENGLEVIIAWDDDLGSDYRPTVAVRLDDGDIDEGAWGLSTDGKATVSPDVDAFFSSMKGASRLVARVWKQDQTTITAQWDVAGFRDAVRPIENKCDPNFVPSPTPTATITPLPTDTPTPAPTNMSISTVTPALVAQVGEPAPDFTITTFENDNYTKDQVINLFDLRGKPVVITFWYPACTPCADLIILLKDAYDNRHSENVHFIAIQESLGGQSEWDPPSNPEVGQKFTTDEELQFIVAFDPDSNPDAEDKRGSIAKAYNVRGWPTTYFLNKDLTICAAETYLRERTIEDNIEAVSAGSGTDCPEPR